MMKPLTLLLLLLVLVLVVHLSSSACSLGIARVGVLINTTASLAEVPATFLSTTIEISQLYVPGRLPDTQNPRFVNLARNLAPLRLRVGGTRGDTFYYDLGPDPVRTPPAPYTIVMNASMVDRFCQFAQKIDAQVVMGINAGQGPRSGTADGSWSPANLEGLLAYVQAHDYPVLGFEFGNEPNLFLYKFGSQATVPPEQYGRDFLVFQRTLQRYNASWWAVGADVDYAPVVGEHVILPDYDQRFLAVAAPVLDAYTFHFYPLMNKEKLKDAPEFLAATPQKLLDPLVLNQVGFWGRRVQERLRNYTASAELWLGETGSSVGGGAPNISDRYVDGIEWLDKLGQLSQLGLTTVMRQTLSQSDDGDFAYGLMTYDLEPHPSYWMAVLFKQLVGSRALPVQVLDPLTHKHVRTYAYCGKRRGSVVLTALNLQQQEAALLDFRDRLGDLQYEAYHMTAALQSDLVQLNNQTLQANADGTVPPLPPAVTGSFRLRLDPASYVFVVFTDANASACR